MLCEVEPQPVQGVIGAYHDIPHTQPKPRDNALVRSFAVCYHGLYLVFLDSVRFKYVLKQRLQVARICLLDGSKPESNILPGTQNADTGA